MSEVTIAEPLSGAEVIERVCEKVKQMLRRDCNLNPALAYEAFSAHLNIQVKLKDCGRLIEVPVDLDVMSDNPVDDNEALEIAEASLYEAPPNEVRRQAGLPIPTLVTDSSGKQTIKPVKYVRQRDGSDLKIDTGV